VSLPILQDHPFTPPIEIVSLDLKHNEASFSTNSIDWLCLRVAQVPRSRDMAIFVSTDRQTDKPIALPLAAHARTRGKYCCLYPLIISNIFINLEFFLTTGQQCGCIRIVWLNQRPCCNLRSPVSVSFAKFVLHVMAVRQ
jgi:hypothetical protein